MDDTKKQRVVLHSPRDTKYSGYRVKCGKCGVVKLTLAEVRQQVTDKPEQVWRCPKCGSIAAFKERPGHNGAATATPALCDCCRFLCFPHLFRAAAAIAFLCTQLPSRLLRCAFRFVVLSPPLLLSVQNGRAEPALPKVQRFSGLVTANEHKDQPSSSYRQDAAEQNQFSWHKFSCRLC
jgi:ribosomal protein S27AE